MKKITASFLSLVLLCTLVIFSPIRVSVIADTPDIQKWQPYDFTFQSSYAGTDLISGVQSTFEQSTVPTGWSAFGGGTVSTSTTVAHSGTYSLLLAGRSSTWYSPTFNIYNTLKTGGAGVYTITLWVYTDKVSASTEINSSGGSLLIRGGDSSDANSFIINHGGSYYGLMESGVNTFLKSWTQYSVTFPVLDSDLTRASGTFNVVVDSLYAVSGENLYIDDFQVAKQMGNELSGTASTFETASVPAGWSAFGGGTLSTSTTVAHNGTYSLKLAGRTQTWYSPSYNIYSILKAGGAGHYDIKFWMYADSLSTSPSNARVLVRGADSSDANSFISDQGGGVYYGILNPGVSVAEDTWTQCTASFDVLASDITRASGTFNLVIDILSTGTSQNLYWDDVQIYKGYATPFDDVTMDCTFTGPGDIEMVMPSFWNGGNTWVVRFAPTITGSWSYATTCSNTADTGLHNKTGSLNCVSYSGDLDIYKNGFVKTVSNTRYFKYDNDTPFFYLGDTHWNMPAESYDSSTVDGISSQFKHIVDNRVTNGFTVYQSEPIGASYALYDGFSSSDLWGFTDLDRRFKYIADSGLVHANASLVFSTELQYNAQYYPAAYLQKLARYWVARYAAYPVMWTTAQEVDQTCYGAFDRATSPWKTVFNALHQYDPYQHPLTAHQEYTGYTTASNSAYKDLDGHSWFAAQWSVSKNSVDFTSPKDYWNYSGSKPAVVYEPRYENLWTNELGSRIHGWTAYLDGMSGIGYGAQDIWCYNTDYDENQDTTDGNITVTTAMKKVTWDTSVDFNTPAQLGHMRDFFESISWNNLTPRFDDSTWFTNNSSYYALATESNTNYVAYFYNTSTNTGTLKNMASATYTAKWFNPRTGEYTKIGTVIPSSGQWTIPSKPDGNDWALIVTTSSLIDQWSFDSSGSDSVGSNTATANGGLSYTTGKKYNGASLDGTNDNFTVADSSSLKGMSGLTCSIWVKFNSLPAGNCQFYNKEQAYRLNISNTGLIHFVVATANNSWYSAGTIASASTAISTGTWYHIVGVYNGSHVYLYINGSQAGSGTQDISGNIVSNANSLNFGKDHDNYYLNGMIDEALLYNTGLSSTQVTDLYDSYNGGSPGSFTLNTPSNSATGVSTTPIFKWGESSSADSYALVVSPNSNLSSPVINQNGITAVSYTSSTTLSANTTYYWKVTAVNGTGSTDASNSNFSFSTLNVTAPISEWRFENNGNDSIGSNNATASGGYNYIKGKKNYNAYLFGTNGNFSVADAASLKGMSALTCSIWVKFNTLPAGNCQIYNKEATYRINVDNNGGLHFAVATVNNSWYSAGTTASSSVNLVPQKWYHIVGVYTGSHVYIYINGTQTGSGTNDISGNIVSNTNGLKFGKDNDNNYVNGQIDEAQIYNTGLNSTQITALFNSYQ
ncbi:MAG: LamG-like jellyroll fold domain-containing protein [Saccharofermentanales bacterium]